WLSDALCRLATGGGFATRELYSDSDETIFNAMRPVLLNGIDELAVRSDLLDRAVITGLPTIPDEARRPEKTFWAEFEAVRPQVLGALLTAVSRALADEGAVTLAKLPRMADFGVWAVAAAPAFGWTGQEFLDAYTGARQAANDLPLEASLIAPFVLQLADTDTEGTATELLARLSASADEASRRAKAWPTGARALTNELRRLAPNLRGAGVNVNFRREPRTGRRLIEISRGAPASPSSPASPLVEEPSTGASIPGDAPCAGDDPHVTGDARVTCA